MIRARVSEEAVASDRARQGEIWQWEIREGRGIFRDQYLFGVNYHIQQHKRNNNTVINSSLIYVYIYIYTHTYLCVYLTIITIYTII